MMNVEIESIGDFLFKAIIKAPKIVAYRLHVPFFPRSAFHCFQCEHR